MKFIHILWTHFVYSPFRVKKRTIPKPDPRKFAIKSFQQKWLLGFFSSENSFTIPTEAMIEDPANEAWSWSSTTIFMETWERYSVPRKLAVKWWNLSWENHKSCLYTVCLFFTYFVELSFIALIPSTGFAPQRGKVSPNEREIIIKIIKLLFFSTVTIRNVG